MSIKVTYEYTCDICGGEAWQKETHEYGWISSATYLQPRRLDNFGDYCLCSQCKDAVFAALRERRKG